MIDKRYKLTYTDAKGETSERIVRNPVFQGETVRAMCELRAAVRTFRRDRIQSVVDMETGEILEDNQ